MDDSSITMQRFTQDCSQTLQNNRVSPTDMIEQQQKYTELNDEEVAAV